MNSKIGLIGLVFIMVVLAAGAIYLLINNQQIKKSETVSSLMTQDSKTPDTSRKITLAEVNSHNSPKDCWFAIDGSVYNVSGFVSKHPGGKDILEGCGKDATTLFHNREGKEDHSDTAKKMLPQYKIGELMN